MEEVLFAGKGRVIFTDLYHVDICLWGLPKPSGTKCSWVQGAAEGKEELWRAMLLTLVQAGVLPWAGKKGYNWYVLEIVFWLRAQFNCALGPMLPACDQLHIKSTASLCGGSGCPHPFFLMSNPFVSWVRARGEHTFCLGTSRAGWRKIPPVAPASAYTFPSLPKPGSKGNVPIGGWLGPPALPSLCDVMMWHTCDIMMSRSMPEVQKSPGPPLLASSQGCHNCDIGHIRASHSALGWRESLCRPSQVAGGSR